MQHCLERKGSVKVSYKSEIIQMINDMSGARSSYEIFSDWIQCASLSISNLCTTHLGRVYKQREQLYLDTLKRHPEGTEEKFALLTAKLALLLEDHMTDALGEIYMESSMGSKTTGQFFTPFHLSELTARTALEDTLEDYDGESMIHIQEPSVGGGGMVIAAAKVLRDHGINYQRKMKVIAQDLDWKGVYMSYLQCSLLGIRMTIYQGDTLSEPFDRMTDPFRILRTPAEMGVLI